MLVNAQVAQGIDLIKPQNALKQNRSLFPQLKELHLLLQDNNMRAAADKAQSHYIYANSTRFE